MTVDHAPKTIKDIQAEYDHLFATDPIRDEDRAYQYFAEKLIEQMPQMTSVIDIACGGGYFFKQLNPLARPGTRMVGIDISSEALKLAQVECPQAEYLLSEAEHIAFPDETFDAVTCLGSLEHFLDIGKAIDEMKRLLRPRGVILILVPNIFWYKDILSVAFTGQRKVRNQTNERFASLGEWTEIFEDLGLKVSTVKKYNGIAVNPLKQQVKDLVIPVRFSYHFLFICKKKS